MTHSCTLEQSTWVNVAESSLIMEGDVVFQGREFYNSFMGVHKHG